MDCRPLQYSLSHQKILGHSFSTLLCLFTITVFILILPLFALSVSLHHAAYLYCSSTYAIQSKHFTASMKKHTPHPSPHRHLTTLHSLTSRSHNWPLLCHQPPLRSTTPTYLPPFANLSSLTYIILVSFSTATLGCWSWR